MTILGIYFTPLQLTVICGTAWFGFCILLAVVLCRRGGPYDRPDYAADQAKADEEFAPIARVRREEMAARFQ
ncbi:hypothetical protein U8C35_07665 [Sinorhizobium medicae]|uniref:hypothetical protein n=1 Tax=Sinorhizobium medicae TaxID=110321 RepID=UPI002AF6C020|nr:hypothetical protein [Sinorhizobium medicae]WQO60288.1 hypothetical protein U8C35_07665 [Sinorhizobium medicae]